jgi:hypothetical protein
MKVLMIKEDCGFKPGNYYIMSTSLGRQYVEAGVAIEITKGLIILKPEDRLEDPIEMSPAVSVDSTEEDMYDFTMLFPDEEEAEFNDSTS